MIDKYLHNYVPERHPRKQGLKLVSAQSHAAREAGVPERHPRKQGLKLGCVTVGEQSYAVPERHPRKQELKLRQMR